MSSRTLAIATVAVCVMLASPLLWTLSQPGVYVGNGTDLFSYQIPARAFVATSLRAGEFPFWNPYVLGGVSLHAATQLGLTYPPNLLAALCFGVHCNTWLLALHLLWLAFGAMVLARAHQGQLANFSKISPREWLTACGVATVLIGSGPCWGHVFAGHISFIAAFSWLPFVWAFAIDAQLRHKLASLLAAGAALALQVLAGHPQVTYLTIVGLGFALLAHAVGPQATFGKRYPSSNSLIMIVVAAFTGAIALALSAAQWWPTLQVADTFNRSLATPHEIATAYSAPVQSLWTLLAPQIWGGVSTPLAAFSYHETVAYVPSAALALVLLRFPWTGPRGWVLAAGVAFCLTMSLGDHGPLLEPLLDLLPGAASFRVPGRWLLPATGLLALLVAETSDVDDLKQKKPRWPTLALCALVATWLAIQATTLDGAHGWWADAILPKLKGSNSAQLLAITSRNALMLAACLAAIGCLAAWWTKRTWISGGLVAISLLQGVWFGAQHVGAERQMPSENLQWQPDEVAALQKLVDDQHRLATAPALRMTNWAGQYRLRAAGGYEPVVSVDTNRYANLLAGRATDGYAVMFQIRRPSPWLDRMAVGALLLDGSDRSSAQAFSTWPQIQSFASGRVLRQNPHPLPRLAWAGRLDVQKDNKLAVEAIKIAPVDVSILSRPLTHVQGAGLSIEVTGDHATELHVKAAASAPCVLLVRDALAPGWQATVDGVAVQAAVADGLFRAISVPSGTHDVVWRYRAPGFAGAFVFSLLAWIALGVALAIAVKRRI